MYSNHSHGLNHVAQAGPGLVGTLLEILHISAMIWWSTSTRRGGGIVSLT